MTAAIKYHNILHGFRTGRGTRTAIFKAKMLHHLKFMREVVLHTILLDIQKAYASLEQDPCFGILTRYGVGPRTLQLLWTYRTWLRMAAKAGG